jgi:hypothetical protein
MIESYSFGSMTITGQSHQNDLKIIDDKIVGNWWRREGHALYAQDIDDILYASVETLSLVAVPTKEAVSIFNSLHAQGKRVAGAFHLTC